MPKTPRPNKMDPFPKEMRRNFWISVTGLILQIWLTFLAMDHGMNYLAAYALGIGLNALFATLLRKAFLNRYMESLNISYSKLLLAYLIFSMASVLFLYFVVEVLGGTGPWIVIGSALLFSGLHFAIVGLWAFVKLPIQEVIYEELDAEFFDDMMNEKKVGGFRAWIHRSRFDLTQRLVSEVYAPGKKIVDFASGSCNWNLKKLPVIGLDVNEKMLGHGLKTGRLTEINPGDMYASPFADNFADIAVSSQVFEHLNDPSGALEEIRRVLKPGGAFIIDVPYDLFLGPYFFLFNIHCFIEGYIKGSDLYKQRCGHMNHFTRRTLRRLLEEKGFRVRNVRICNLITLHVLAEKSL